MKTWVAVVNRSEARLFEMNEKKGVPDKNLILLKKLENPKGRLRNREINADRPGTFPSRFAFSRTNLVKKQSPTEHVAETFAKSISEELEKGQNDHLFDQLILVGEPSFLGKVKAALSKKTTNSVRSTLHKDLVNVPDHQIHTYIWPEPARVV